MTEVIKDYLKQFNLGVVQSYKNLAVLPILSDYSVSIDYLTLDEALTDALVEVVEIDQDASVPELKVINKSNKMILILDGEELVGAKQNRIVNTTILIPANETVVIPVSCVEQGRWSYETHQFYTENRMAPCTLRLQKAQQVNYFVKETGKFKSDQRAIWDEISTKASRRHAESDSMAMAEIYKKDRPAVEDYLKNFRVTNSQIGAVFVINGKVVGVESFGRRDTFEKTYRKLIESYALDAIDWQDSDAETKISESEANTLITSMCEADVEAYNSVGLGTDCRIESGKCNGFALTHEEQVLHLVVFVADANTIKPRSVSRMQRFSSRRNSRRRR